MPGKIFRKWDLALIGGVLVLALILLFSFTFAEKGGIAVIEQNGVEWGRYPLLEQQEERILEIGGEYHVRLLLEPGAISFLSSDCPDHTCVRTGKLTQAGQGAVCLPARISIRILPSPGETQGFDGITG